MSDALPRLERLALAVAHLGDSRGYLWHDGELLRVTNDHTWVQSLIDEGRITEVGEGTVAVAQTVRVGDRVAVEATARVTFSMRTPQPSNS